MPVFQNLKIEFLFLSEIVVDRGKVHVGLLADLSGQSPSETQMQQKLRRLPPGYDTGYQKVKGDPFSYLSSRNR